MQINLVSNDAFGGCVDRTTHLMDHFHSVYFGQLAAEATFATNHIVFFITACNKQLLVFH